MTFSRRFESNEVKENESEGVTCTLWTAMDRVRASRKCIFCEYLRLFAAREEHAVTRACDGKASAFMVSQACTSHMDQNQWPQDAILQEIAYATHCERLVHSHGMDLFGR